MPKLDVVSSAGVRQLFSWKSDVFLVGRFKDADAVLASNSVSRHHARIFRKFKQWFIEDLQSRNGTFVNGRQITDPKELKDLDSIRIGEFKCRFYLDEARAPSFSPEIADDPPLRQSRRLAAEAGRPQSHRDAHLASLAQQLQGIAGAGELDNPLVVVPVPQNDLTLKAPLEPIREQVDCTVFSPPTALLGQTIMVQVFAHLPTEGRQAAHLALEFDSSTKRRAFKSLCLELTRRTKLSIHLEMANLTIDESVQDLIWNGRPEAAQFSVYVPGNRQPGTVIGTVTISCLTVPLAHIKFKLELVNGKERPTETDAQPVGVEVQRYKKAFISYASEDRNEVFKRVQMLRPMNIRFFQDLLSLEPGDRWERALYRHIDDSDLFLLFWSSAAKKSKWVMEEVKYALKRKEADELAPPEIKPVIIEGPPSPQPPDELKHLHFNDYLLYFLSGC